MVLSQAIYLKQEELNNKLKAVVAAVATKTKKKQHRESL